MKSTQDLFSSADTATKPTAGMEFSGSATHRTKRKSPLASHIISLFFYSLTKIKMSRSRQSLGTSFENTSLKVTAPERFQLQPWSWSLLKGKWVSTNFEWCILYRESRGLVLLNDKHVKHELSQIIPSQGGTQPLLSHHSLPPVHLTAAAVIQQLKTSSPRSWFHVVV